MIVSHCLVRIGLTVSLIIAISLFSLSLTLQLGGLAQEQKPTISICQEELNETKCNQIEPVCPGTFPGCVGNSSSSSNKP